MDISLREPIAGRYRIGQRLGGGGMAEVYDAVDLRLDRPVAVKFLRDALRATPGMVERAEAEARLAAKIHHPNVVAILDAGRVDDTPYVVMERLPGQTLAERFDNAPLDEEEIRSIGVQVLRGLAAAHELGVVHRDIKPSNVLSGPRQTWKLGDFGIATWLAGETTMTATGEIIGSAPYLAPERAEGHRATPASDVFSVGVLLFEAATGRRPVERDDAVATVMAIREGAGEPLSAFRPNLDPALRDAIERALSVDPDARWASATAFADALEQGRSDPATDRTVPMPAVDRTQPLPVTGRTAPLPTDDDRPVATERLATRRSRTRHAPVRRVTRRRSLVRPEPSRALGIALGAALAVVLVIAIAGFAVLRNDAPAAGGSSSTLQPSVPSELRSSMDDLREAIEP